VAVSHRPALIDIADRIYRFGDGTPEMVRGEPPAPATSV
jgi:hypothetical protein